MSEDLDRDKQLEHYKHTLARDLEQVKDHYHRNDAHNQSWSTMYEISVRATLEFGVHAAKGIFILNGAAVIALLAFLGSNRQPSAEIAVVAPALGVFAMGALAAVLNMGFAYLTQMFFSYAIRARKEISKLGFIFQGLAIFLFVVGVALFLLGLVRSATAFHLSLSSIF